MDLFEYMRENTKSTREPLAARMRPETIEEVVGQDKKGNDDIRTVLHLHPALAPFKCAIVRSWLLCSSFCPAK